MKEYRLELKIKNNFILSRMDEMGIKSMKHLSELSDVYVQEISLYIRLLRSPFKKDGSYRSNIKRLANALKCKTEDLIPEEYLVKQDNVSYEMDLPEFVSLNSNWDPLLIGSNDKELTSSVDSVLESLTAREEYIIKKTYGIDCDEETLKQIACEFDLTPPRIRQIREKALRKLRHPINSRKLKKYFFNDNI